MKTNLLKMAAVFMAAASMTACSKDKDSKSKTELITKAAWKFEAGGIDADLNGTVDAGSIDDCDKDDIATFAVNGTGTLDEGTIKCDVGDPQSLPFTWQFKNDEKEIEYDGTTYKILSLDENQAKIYLDEAIGGQTYRFLLILKH